MKRKRTNFLQIGFKMKKIWTKNKHNGDFVFIVTDEIQNVDTFIVQLMESIEKELNEENGGN